MNFMTSKQKNEHNAGWYVLRTAILHIMAKIHNFHILTESLIEKNKITNDKAIHIDNESYLNDKFSKKKGLATKKKRMTAEYIGLQLLKYFLANKTSA